MTDGIVQCAAAMQFEQRRLESAAENLANADTDGFRAHLPKDETGPLRPTGRPYDFSVAGPGAMRLARVDAQGRPGASIEVKSASLRRDVAGRLVDGGGRALVGAGGFVKIPDGAQARTDGAFTLDGSVVARVGLAPGAELRPGFLAGSDVNPIGEMVQILDAQRQFETAQKTLSALDQAREKAASDVGKIQ